nr:cytochrome c [Lysobacter sp. CAU 1642]
MAWILLGLMIGAFATLSVLNALRPATAFPKGVMALFGHHLGAARDQVTAGKCDADLARHVEALAILSRDVRPAFLPIGEQDELFGDYADKLQQAAESARQTALTDCAEAGEALGRIGDSCKACHRDFKS